MRFLIALALVGFVLPAVAAPVPKEKKKKSLEERLIGTWKLVKDTSGEEPQAYTFTITFKKDGAMDFTREYKNNAIPPRVSPGKFKAIEPDEKNKLGTIDWKVKEGDDERGEVSKILELTEDDLEFEDPEGQKERFRRVKENEKKAK